MTESDRQSRVKQILDEAAELSQAERSRFLDEACASDDTLRSEVESLLRHLELPTGTAANAGSDPNRSERLIDIPPPSRIGPYSIIDKIGEGGMGVVYKATQELPRRTVALKVIKPQMLTRHALERFNFETQVLGRLQHPGIAQIYEAGTTQTEFGEQPYFAMEYIRGTPLADYAKLRKCSLQERLVLVQRIADAVHHAHTRGVVHRDLKPANILVTEDGQPKILDFGVARSIGSDLHETTSKTRIGQLVGTVPYMSPEQVAGESEEIDARSDIYSLGVVLYELLAGHLPYDLERRLIHEAVRVIREVEPENLSRISRVYRGDIETIVNKALAKERSRRYQSASEFASDIDRYLHNQPVSARPPSAWYQVSKLARRHRMVAVGGSVAAAGIVVGLAVAVWQLDRATSAERSLAQQNQALESALATVQSEKQRAEQALEHLGDLVDAFADYEHDIRRLEGATKARKVLLTSAMGVLDNMAGAGETYPWVALGIARGKLAMGQIALSSPDTLAVADAGFSDAISAFEKLHADAPADSIATHGHIRALLGLSAVRLRQGATQAAVALSADALQRAERTASEQPSPESSVLLAACRLQRAGVHAHQARRDEALALYERAETDLRALTTDDPEAAELLARAVRGQAVVLDEQGDHARADERYQVALDLHRAFVELHPRDAVGKHRLMEALYYAAERLEEQGKDAEALDIHTERLAVAEALRHADPFDDIAVVAIITSHDAIAHAQLELGRLDLASRSADAFLSAARLHAETDPTDLQKHRRVALAEEFLGDLQREPIEPRASEVANADARDAAAADSLLATLSSAMSHYDEAMATIEWLRSNEADSSQFTRDAIRLQVKRGRTLELMGRLEAENLSGPASEAAYTAASTGYRALDNSGELTDSERALWARAVRNLATAALNRGAGPDAVQLFEEADTILPASRPDVIARKAAAYSLAGNNDKARSLATEALALLASEPDSDRTRWITQQLRQIVDPQPLPTTP